MADNLVIKYFNGKSFNNIDENSKDEIDKVHEKFGSHLFKTAIKQIEIDSNFNTYKNSYIIILIIFIIGNSAPYYYFENLKNKNAWPSKGLGGLFRKLLVHGIGFYFLYSIIFYVIYSYKSFDEGKALENKYQCAYLDNPFSSGWGNPTRDIYLIPMQSIKKVKEGISKGDITDEAELAKKINGEIKYNDKASSSYSGSSIGGFVLVVIFCYIFAHLITMKGYPIFGVTYVYNPFSCLRILELPAYLLGSPSGMVGLNNFNNIFGHTYYGAKGALYDAYKMRNIPIYSPIEVNLPNIPFLKDPLEALFKFILYIIVSALKVMYIYTCATIFLNPLTAFILCTIGYVSATPAVFVAGSNAVNALGKKINMFFLKRWLYYFTQGRCYKGNVFAGVLRRLCTFGFDTWVADGLFNNEYLGLACENTFKLWWRRGLLGGCSSNDNNETDLGIGDFFKNYPMAFMVRFFSAPFIDLPGFSGLGKLRKLYNNSIKDEKIVQQIFWGFWMSIFGCLQYILGIGIFKSHNATYFGSLLRYTIIFFIATCLYSTTSGILNIPNFTTGNPSIDGGIAIGLVIFILMLCLNGSVNYSLGFPNMSLIMNPTKMPIFGGNQEPVPGPEPGPGPGPEQGQASVSASASASAPVPGPEQGQASVSASAPVPGPGTGPVTGPGPEPVPEQASAPVPVPGPGPGTGPVTGPGKGPGTGPVTGPGPEPVPEQASAPVPGPGPGPAQGQAPAPAPATLVGGAGADVRKNYYIDVVKTNKNFDKTKEITEEIYIKGKIKFEDFYNSFRNYIFNNKKLITRIEEASKKLNSSYKEKSKIDSAFTQIQESQKWQEIRIDSLAQIYYLLLGISDNKLAELAKSDENLSNSIMQYKQLFNTLRIDTECVDLSGPEEKLRSALRFIKYPSDSLKQFVEKIIQFNDATSKKVTITEMMKKLKNIESELKSYIDQIDTALPQDKQSITNSTKQQINEIIDKLDESQNLQIPSFIKDIKIKLESNDYKNVRYLYQELSKLIRGLKSIGVQTGGNNAINKAQTKNANPTFDTLYVSAKCDDPQCDPLNKTCCPSSATGFGKVMYNEAEHKDLNIFRSKICSKGDVSEQMDEGELYCLNGANIGVKGLSEKIKFTFTELSDANNKNNTSLSNGEKSLTKGQRGGATSNTLYNIKDFSSNNPSSLGLVDSFKRANNAIFWSNSVAGTIFNQKNVPPTVCSNLLLSNMMINLDSNLNNNQGLAKISEPAIKGMNNVDTDNGIFGLLSYPERKYYPMPELNPFDIYIELFGQKFSDWTQFFTGSGTKEDKSIFITHTGDGNAITLKDTYLFELMADKSNDASVEDCKKMYCNKPRCFEIIKECSKYPKVFPDKVFMQHKYLKTKCKCSEIDGLTPLQHEEGNTKKYWMVTYMNNALQDQIEKEALGSKGAKCGRRTPAQQMLESGVNINNAMKAETQFEIEQLNNNIKGFINERKKLQSKLYKSTKGGGSLETLHNVFGKWTTKLQAKQKTGQQYFFPVEYLDVKRGKKVEIDDIMIDPVHSKIKVSGVDELIEYSADKLREMVNLYMQESYKAEEEKNKNDNDSRMRSNMSYNDYIRYQNSNQNHNIKQNIMKNEDEVIGKADSPEEAAKFIENYVNNKKSYQSGGSKQLYSTPEDDTEKFINLNGEKIVLKIGKDEQYLTKDGRLISVQEYKRKDKYIDIMTIDGKPMKLKVKGRYHYLTKEGKLIKTTKKYKVNG